MSRHNKLKATYTCLIYNADEQAQSQVFNISTLRRYEAAALALCVAAMKPR
jgi:hypothetical protein